MAKETTSQQPKVVVKQRPTTCEAFVLKQYYELQDLFSNVARQNHDLEQENKVLKESHNELIGLLKDFVKLVRIDTSDKTYPSKVCSIYIKDSYVAGVWKDDTEFDSLIKLVELVNAIPEREEE